MTKVTMENMYCMKIRKRKEIPRRALRELNGRSTFNFKACSSSDYIRAHVCVEQREGWLFILLYILTISTFSVQGPIRQKVSREP